MHLSISLACLALLHQTIGAPVGLPPTAAPLGAPVGPPQIPGQKTSGTGTSQSMNIGGTVGNGVPAVKQPLNAKLPAGRPAMPAQSPQLPGSYLDDDGFNDGINDGFNGGFDNGLDNYGPGMPGPSPYDDYDDFDAGTVGAGLQQGPQGRPPAPPAPINPPKIGGSNLAKPTASQKSQLAGPKAMGSTGPMGSPAPLGQAAARNPPM